jgi:GR25 family glycosyltransferase involved in LPS biosynthesis
MDNILESPSFVIHLTKKCPERKNYFMNNIQNAGYKNINIFDAINAHDENELDEALKMFNYPKIDKSLGKGQIGCLLSHLKLYKYIIDNNIEISNIFEDDVYFHPEWNKLSIEYYNDTPKDFDIIFIGNQIYNSKAKKINKEPCFCTHAYIITLEGAKKIYNLILNFGFNIELNNELLGENYNGIFVIDFIFYKIQDRTNKNQINLLYNWYCWNGTYYECENNKLPLKGSKEKNYGLVFQSDIFDSSMSQIN